MNRMLHRLAKLLSQFCQFPISPSRTRVEQPEFQANPDQAIRADAPPCSHLRVSLFHLGRDLCHYILLARIKLPYGVGQTFANHNLAQHGSMLPAMPIVFPYAIVKLNKEWRLAPDLLSQFSGVNAGDPDDPVVSQPRVERLGTVPVRRGLAMFIHNQARRPNLLRLEVPEI